MPDPISSTGEFSTITTLISAFVAKALTVQTPTEVEALCKAEIHMLYEEKQYSPTTIATYLSRYKHALVAAGVPQEPFLYITDWTRWNARTDEYRKLPGYLSIPDIHRGETAKSTAANLKERHHSKACEWFDARALMNAATTMLSSPHFTVVLAGLLPLTGRRPYEIAVSATMHPDQENDGYVYYEGQAKTRDSERAHEEFHIPVLARAPIVCEALTRLRTMHDFSEYRQPPPGKDGRIPSDTLGQIPSLKFDRCYGKSLGEVTRRHFNPFFQGDNARTITPKELRKIYVVVAYLFCRTKGQTLSDFAAEKLGHGRMSSAVQNYEDFMPYLMNANLP